MTSSKDAQLHALLLETSDRLPDQPVFIRRGTSTAYGELNRLSSKLAGALQELGIARGDRVALVLDQLVEFPISYYGILKAGGCVVPLCPDTRADSLCYALGHCDARAVILEGNNTKLLEGQGDALRDLEHVISIGSPRLEAQESFAVHDIADLIDSSEPYNDAGAAGDDLASIVYTSGTTGRPKGVMLSHQNLVHNIQSIVQYLELTSSDTIAMVLPFFYVYGNSVLHTHIAVGGSIAMVGSMAFPAAVLKGIQDHACTGLSGVPSTFARFVQFSALDKYDLSSLRYLTQAGGPMTPALTQKLRGALPHVRVFVMYGQTEASARLSYLPPRDLERKLGSAGIAIPGVTLAIMDKNGVEVPRGTVGEIVARGGNVMRGYWKNPEETDRILRPEGLRTGDLARMDEEGYVFIVSRESDMIKSGAHRIGPKEIEDVIEKMPQVAQAAVVGVPDELLGEAIAAFVVPVKGEEISSRQVLQICHEHLPRFKMPNHVRLVDSLPRTQTGKLRRNELKQWFEAAETET
jgi:acyl-CoA synthetase (AMP-forming)/AMP-acid ligase II